MAPSKTPTLTPRAALCEAGAAPSSTVRRRRRSGLHATATAVGLLVVCGFGAGSARAAGPALYANAAPGSTVGLQIYDHTNLMGGASPRGTLNFKLYGPGDTGCASPLFSQTVAVSGTGSDDSSRYTTTAAGTYQWVASYSGDAANDPVATACGNAGQQVIIDKARPVAATTASFSAGEIHGTTTLQGGFAPLNGTITFTVTGPNDQWCSGTPVYTQTVPVKNGAASYDSGGYTPTSAGTYTYRIRYTGDSDNLGVGPSNCLDPGASIAVSQSQIVHAALTNPTTGGVKDTSRPFTWNAVAGAQQYSLWVGSTPGGADLAAAYVSGTTRSYDVALLPAGRTIYARLWALINGAWSVQQDTSFTSGGGAEFTSPTDGQAGLASGALTWSGVPGAQYGLWVGTTRGGNDVGQYSVGSATSYDLALPVGVPLYARVWTMVGGVWLRYDDVAFTAGGGAAFTSMTSGQTGVDPTQPLAWSAAPGAQYYGVWVGTTLGGYDVSVNWMAPGSTSVVPAGLPRGRQLYARMWTMVGGSWDRYQDVSFTTA